MPDEQSHTFDPSLVHLVNRLVSKPCRLFKEFALQMGTDVFPRAADL